jgi:hypothetical protein
VRACSHFLSAFVYDTGFGPKSQQYIEFKAGPSTRSLVFHETVDGKPSACAPKESSGDIGCSETFKSCFYNWEITDLLNKAQGGSVTISAITHGILTSSCPHIDNTTSKRDPVFIRYQLSTELQETPLPTASPTLGPTKSSSVVYNNDLRVDIGDIGAVQALQITAAIGILFCAFGAYLSKLREGAESKAYRLPLFKAALDMGLSAADFINFVFLLNEMGMAGFQRFALVLLAYRVMNSVGALFLVRSTYIALGYPALGAASGAADSLSSIENDTSLSPSTSGDTSSKTTSPSTSFAGLLDTIHMCSGSKNPKIYGLVSVLMVMFGDTTLIVFMPWLNSAFTRMSSGMPNLLAFRLTSAVTFVSALVLTSLQVPYLVESNDSILSKSFSALSISLSVLKVILAALTYFLKNAGLRTASIKPDDEGIAPKVVYVSNPMMLASERGLQMTSLSSPSISSVSSSSSSSVDFVANPMHAAGGGDGSPDRASSVTVKSLDDLSFEWNVRHNHMVHEMNSQIRSLTELIERDRNSSISAAAAATSVDANATTFSIANPLMMTSQQHNEVRLDRRIEHMRASQQTTRSTNNRLSRAVPVVDDIPVHDIEEEKEGEKTL